MRTLARVLMSLLGFAVPLAAQGNPVVDEGSFTVTVGGRTAGRENFRISAIARAENVEFVARADVAYGDRKITAELRTDERGGAFAYEVTRTSDATESWRGAIVRGRLSATITTPRGPAARELIVPIGSLILDDDLYHQFYFVALRTRSGRIPVVLPNRNEQASVTVSTVGNETVQVGTREMRANRLRVDGPGGATTDVWVDDSGRVLRVAVPARRLVAIRDDPPRD